MPIGARRLIGVAITAVVAGTITATGLTSASASPTSCTDIASLKGAALASCVKIVQKRAEVAGVTAAKADESYLKAKHASSDAAAALKELNTQADIAAIKAEQTRSRAAVVAAHLARTGGSLGQTTEVLLSGDGATSVLYHLSRMTELTSDSSQLAGDAARDSATAEGLQQQASLAADTLSTAEQTAKAAYDDAQKTSDAARLLVQQISVKQSGAETASAANVSAYVDLPSDASVAAKVVAFARAQIGEPYVFGAAGPNSWDCSGLTMGAYAAAGIDIGGHGVNVQYAKARAQGLLVPYSQAQPGDLLFYGSGDFYHITMYSGGGNMIEAPYPGKSVREVPVRTAGLAPMVARFSG